MKDIVQCLMSQIGYELRFCFLFFADLSISLWTKNLLSKEMWLLCGKKDHSLNLWKPFLAPKAFCDTEPRENKKNRRVHMYVYIFLRSYTQRVIAIHQTFTECLICFFKITIRYIFIFPLISQVKERWWHFWSLFLWRHSLINVVESSQPDSRVLTLDLITAVCFRLGWRNKRLGKWDSQIQVTGW